MKGKRRVRDDGREDFFDRADLIEYEETPTRIRYRQEVQAINAWLKQADISFDKEAAKRGAVNTELIYAINHVDRNAQQLRRVATSLREAFRAGGGCSAASGSSSNDRRTFAA